MGFDFFGADLRSRILARDSSSEVILNLHTKQTLSAIPLPPPPPEGPNPSADSSQPAQSGRSISSYASVSSSSSNGVQDAPGAGPSHLLDQPRAHFDGAPTLERLYLERSVLTP